MYEELYVDPASSAESGMLTAFGVLLFAAMFVYFAFMQYKMAHRTGQADTAWWAFIPILNTLLLIQMAAKPIWWILLLLVPVVNVVAFFMLWTSVSRNCGQSGVWGFLMLLPLINFVAAFVLAFSTRPYEYPEETAPPADSNQPRPRQTVG
ncbi:MAG: DUF5684 domain-containing protein [candidate division Zixibacteria bacterium]